MIIGLAGRKQSGKTTAGKIIHGAVLKKYGLIENFVIGEHGKLLVKTSNSSGTTGWGEFDIERKDPVFSDYAEREMWPHIKMYNFSDELKKMCYELFDIPIECLYGTDEQKNQKQEHLQWENMPGVGLFNMTKMAGNQGVKGGEMTSREFMQYLGTEIMRNMYAPVWTNATMKRIAREQSEISVICDVRFPNEVKAIKDSGGHVIKLERNMHPEDNHASESSLDCMDKSEFSLIVENQDITIANFSQIICNFLSETSQ